VTEPTTPVSTPTPAGVRVSAWVAVWPNVRPITPADVKAWLKIDPDDTDDDAILSDICVAVMVWVADLPYVAEQDPEYDWPATVHQGAIQLAARWYRRRLSPSGIDAITDAGAVYVARSDPEISQLLHLDNWAYPRVG
jgi:hypothetical protein